jgi:hypothetical protein
MLSGFPPMNLYSNSDPNSALKKRANDRATVTPALKVYQYNGIEEPCFGILLYSHIPIISEATGATSREKDSSRVQQWAGRVISSRLSSSVCVLLLTFGFFSRSLEQKRRMEESRQNQKAVETAQVQDNSEQVSFKIVPHPVSVVRVEFDPSLRREMLHPLLLAGK